MSERSFVNYCVILITCQKWVIAVLYLYHYELKVLIKLPVFCFLSYNLYVILTPIKLQEAQINMKEHWRFGSERESLTGSLVSAGLAACLPKASSWNWSSCTVTADRA